MIKGLIQKLKEERFNEVVKSLNKTVLLNETSVENQKNCGIVDTDNQVILPKEEYARVISVLETWLKTSSIWNKKKYIWKAIETTDGAYMYTFKKINKNNYIIVRKKKV